MEFKIDTKDNFTIIMPTVDRISAKMADKIAETCKKMTQSGSKNFIIDLHKCLEIDQEAIKGMVALHEELYGMEQSLVYTQLTKQVMNTIKKDETDLLLNIAPEMKEAIDIVSMEILERDLLSEEG